MIEIIISLVIGILAMACFNLYECISIPISYEQRMGDLGMGINLPWQDEDGTISQKRFVLYKMNSRELRSLEKDCNSTGLDHKAKEIHQFREFKVKEGLRKRKNWQRARECVREGANQAGLDINQVPLQKLDGFINKVVSEVGFLRLG